MAKPQKNALPKIALPSWLAGPKNTALAQFLNAWWALVQTWLAMPLQQINPMTCSLAVLDLIAWGRHVTRFNNEPLSLYRLRVKHAFVNAVDAGSVAGIKRVFQRLGVGYVDVIERAPGKPWDVIQLRLSDSQLSQNQQLLKLLLQKYGRTCRRYEFDLISPLSLGLSAHEFNHAWYYDRAEAGAL